MKKTFLKSDWIKMRVVSRPTGFLAGVRADQAGRKWKWLASGKRVEAELVP